MVVSGKSLMCNFPFPNHSLAEKSKKSTKFMARKQDFPQDSETKSKFKVSNNILAKSAIAVLGLGFVDAGYSGDWSRIGVISKENEDLLKVAAFLVVPVCFFLIFWLSRKPQNES